MATTPLEVRAPTGLTITVDVFPHDSDTAAQSAIAMTEETNRKGIYKGDVTAAITGWHSVHLDLSGTNIGVFDVNLADTTDTHFARDLVVGMDSVGRDEVADSVLTRDWTSVTGEAARSMLNALRILRNKMSITGSTVTVTEEDDTTTAWTGALTTSASAEPITAMDPD